MILNHPWITAEGQIKDELEEDDSFLPDFSGEIKDSKPFNEDNRPNCEINIEELYFHNKDGRPRAKLCYNDYRELTEDFATMSVSETALQTLESYGYPRKLVQSCLNHHMINHATASYHLLITL
jgi:hypothetical protein